MLPIPGLLIFTFVSSSLALRLLGLYASLEVSGPLLALREITVALTTTLATVVAIVVVGVSTTTTTTSCQSPHALIRRALVALQALTSLLGPSGGSVCGCLLSLQCRQ